MLICSCIHSSSASGDSTQWLIAAPQLGQFNGLAQLGAVNLDHIRLSLTDPPSTRLDVFDSLVNGSRRNPSAMNRCLPDRHRSAVPDLGKVPGWASPGRGNCGLEQSERGGLIPRISIRGSFFSIGYGVELDKKRRGLLIDYGAFTFGVGDSPSGAAVFNGASFGLPRWLPGRRLIPSQFSEGLQFDLGLTLLFDPLSPKKLRPQVGVGVRLAEW